MFSKLKYIKDLRSQAKTIQGVLAQETITTEKKGVHVVIDGNLEIKSITLPSDLTTEKLQTAVADAVNETIKKAQRVMTEKMQAMGGLPKMP